MEEKNYDKETLVICKSISSMEIEMETLIDFLKGFQTEEIFNLKLNKDPYIGIFSHLNKKEIHKLIKISEDKGVIEINNKIKLTKYGESCVKENELLEFKPNVKYSEIKLSEKEQLIVSENKEFFNQLNEGQIRSIISESKKIICIAGAGSGKTTVLTKRIEYLVENKKIKGDKILAITFTKKAKEHMVQKLNDKNINNVEVQTFNSFGQKILNKNKIYKKVIEQNEKYTIVNEALKQNNYTWNIISKEYFKEEKITGKDKFIFIEECFSIRDYLNNENKEMYDFSKNSKNIIIAEIIYKIVNYINSYLRKYNRIDFSDQISLSLKYLYKEKYKHILVDEYQDINLIQEQMLEKINYENLFCVGDPRQSIYGWRGSRIEFIENFKGEKIFLTKNYRSAKEIIDLGNKIIKSMQLPDLESTKGNGIVELKRLNYRQDEFMFVAKQIQEKLKQIETKKSEEEIYIISRTNKSLNELSEILNKINIKHKIKENEINNLNNQDKARVTLMTTHESKGLEAEIVFVINCTSRMYPCQTQEFGISKEIKHYYNKKEEEKRLLYVAITRAKKELYISYFGKQISPFLKEIIKHNLNPKDYDKENRKENNLNLNKIDKIKETELIKKLKELRKEISNKNKIPEFLIISNEEIEEITNKNIKTIQDLKPIIKNRANKFGKEIIEIISD